MRLACLAGDADGSGAVTAADLLAVRGHSGQAVSGVGALWDIDRSGAVTMADVRAAMRYLGNTLP
ncbi:MAG: hypothetical protein JXL80_11900 [Planctomycetes bacterium]|nr:hypothetical protein [Planctomycetota bacterium]